MREMKDSGVEWIGSQPGDWQLVRFRYLHGGTNVGEAINKYFWTEDEYDRLFYTAGLKPLRTNYAEFPLWKLTSKADLLLARNGTPYVYLPEEDAAYTDHIIRVTINGGVDKRFVRYCLQQSISYEIVDTVSITTWSASIWNRQSLPLPTYEEQVAIANFLDDRLQSTDILINNVQTQIEKLKAYKQSLITEVVTKGLDPAVPMKDSGVEWIGEIPKHWEVTRIKNLFDLCNERNDEADLSKVNLISLYTDLGVVQHSDLTETTGNRAVTAEGYKIVQKNDIVVNIILCWMGAVGMSNYDGVTSPAYDIYRSKEGTLSEYYHYLFRTQRFNGECYRYGRGIMMMRWRTYSTEFRAISIPCPPHDEQIAIITHLKSKCSQIDHLITLKQQKIDKLNEYKKSLIYEYVTGKREVV